jgi:hypothetical protein
MAQNIRNDNGTARDGGLGGGPSGAGAAGFSSGRRMTALLAPVADFAKLRGGVWVDAKAGDDG